MRQVTSMRPVGVIRTRRRARTPCTTSGPATSTPDPSSPSAAAEPPASRGYQSVASPSNERAVRPPWVDGSFALDTTASLGHTALAHSPFWANHFQRRETHVQASEEATHRSGGDRTRCRRSGCDRGGGCIGYAQDIILSYGRDGPLRPAGLR